MEQRWGSLAHSPVPRSPNLCYTLQVFSSSSGQRYGRMQDALPNKPNVGSTALATRSEDMSSTPELNSSSTSVRGARASSVRAWTLERVQSLDLVLFEQCATITLSRVGTFVTATFGSAKMFLFSTHSSFSRDLTGWGRPQFQATPSRCVWVSSPSRFHKHSHLRGVAVSPSLQPS